MKTKTSVVAQFLASAIWADGEFSAVERNFLNEIASNFELETLLLEVESLIPQLSTMDGAKLTQSLEVAAKEVDTEEKDGLLVLCMQMMGSDSYLVEEEISNFFVLAKTLGIDEERAKMIMTEFSEDDEAVVE